MAALTAQFSAAKALLFDLDGTLLDSVPDLAVAIDRSLAEHSLPKAGEATVRHWVGNGAVKLCARALAAQRQLNEAQLSETDVKAFHHCFLQHYAECSGAFSNLYEGVITALTAWQTDYPLALVTNKPIQFVPHLLQQFDLERFFGIVLGGDSLSEKKPHPMPLLHVCKLLNIHPQQAVMFGDSRTDIQAAKNAGMPVVALTYGYNHGEPVVKYEPTLVVDNLTELLW